MSFLRRVGRIDTSVVVVAAAQQRSARLGRIMDARLDQIDYAIVQRNGHIAGEG